MRFWSPVWWLFLSPVGGMSHCYRQTIREMKVTWGWGVEKIGTVSSLGEQGTVIQLDSRALDSKEKAATCKGSSRRGVRELGSTIWWPGRWKGGWWAESVGCARRPLNPSTDLGDCDRHGCPPHSYLITSPPQAAAASLPDAQCLVPEQCVGDKTQIEAAAGQASGPLRLANQPFLPQSPSLRVSGKCPFWGAYPTDESG